MHNEATKDTRDAIALGYTVQDYAGTCIACDAKDVTVTSCGRCIPCAIGKGRKSHEAGERRTFAYVKAELARVGMSICKTDGEYRVYAKGGSAMGYFTTSLDDALTTGRINALSLNVEHVTMTLALVDPFQSAAAYRGRLSAEQRREWAAMQLAEINVHDANLVAKLLEERAATCTYNANQCRELYAGLTADYWTEQHDIAARLAVKFRDAGK